MSKYQLKQRVKTPAGDGQIITLPPSNGNGSQIYIVLLDNGRGIQCDEKQIVVTVNVHSHN